MKPGDIINTKEGPRLYMGGETTDKASYKKPITSGLTAAGSVSYTHLTLPTKA